MNRKLMSSALAALLGCHGFAFAQEAKYPVKPVRMVVGYAPGGGSDIMGRLIATQITEAMGQQVIVKAVQKEEFRTRLAQMGADPITETPEYFRKMLNEEIERWGKVVKASGIKP